MSPPMRPEVIVHHRAQAEAVLHAAREAGVDIQLRSAPDAASHAGVGYLEALGEAIGHELLIDCGDDAGLVMAALRAGCRKLVFSGGSDEAQRLSQMAGRHGAILRGSSDPCLPSLALLPDDDGESIRPWFDAQPDR